MEVEILSLIVALLAVLISPFVTYRLSMKNLEFQFRTMIKEHWVTKIEDAAHLFLYTSSEWINKYPHIKDGSWHTENPNKEIEKMLDAINSSMIKLQFLLDDKNKEQDLILINVASTTTIIYSKVYDENSLSTLKKNHSELIITLQKIFHYERTKMANLFRNTAQLTLIYLKC